MNKIALYTNTIRMLRPIQVLSRLRPKVHVGDKKIDPLEVNAVRIKSPELDEDKEFLQRFDIEALKTNTFYLINESHSVDMDKWNCSEASHLWNFNLHYFEYCIPLAVRFSQLGDREDYALFKRLVSSWIEACRYPHGDAWHPYTISLRLINWLVCCNYYGEVLLNDRAFYERLLDSMYLQYRHLLRNQETRLLGNHYWENLKTLVIMALFFSDRKVQVSAEKKLVRQLEEQILPDGVHFERSLMYHKIVLEGLVRLKLAYRSASCPSPKLVDDCIRRMVDAMASIERGMGKTPFFNDAADDVAKTGDSLAMTCEREFGHKPRSVATRFPQSGFYKLYADEAALLFFAGWPGPSYMLGHSHCDILSFEFSLGGHPLFVNSGTYAYQTPLRPYFRGASAHNVASPAGHDQMLCWGAHRVARSIKEVKVHEASPSRVVASFIDWEGTAHKRSISFLGHHVTVEDWIDNDAGVISYLKVAPKFTVRVGENGAIVSDGEKEVRIVSDSKPLLEKTPYSPEFGIIEDAQRLCFTSDDAYCSYEFEW